MRWTPRVAPVRALVVLLLGVSACSDATAPDDGVVGGVDLDALFAPPTPSEIAAVETEWSGRSTDAADVSVLVDSMVSVESADFRVRVISHQVRSVLHHGAILTPDTLSAPAPILIYAHAGDAGVSVDDILPLLPFVGDTLRGFVWVIPSFRGESLEFGTSEWTSEGPASPWDLDVDDALALLSATEGLESLADPDRVGVLGFSRGAGVGLLMSARDERIDRVVAFSGPTDFFGPSMRELAEESLLGVPPDLPGLDVIDETYLQPLARGEISIAEVRLALVRRSSALFAHRLAAVQLHHGTADEVVDVGQAQALIDAMSALGRGEPDFQAYLYEGGTHNPLSLSNSIPQAVGFLTLLR